MPGAHVEEGGDHVDRAEDRRGTRDVNREDRQIHRHAGLVGRERRIEHPAHARAKLTVAARRQQRGHAKRGARNEQPEAEVVHPRKRHVRRADLQRHEVVAETTEECGDHDEEHHQDAVIGDHHVPQVAVGCAFGDIRGDEARAFHAHVLNARFHQFHPHIDGEHDRDETDDRRGDQVEDTDILVVRGHEPPGKEPALIFVFVAVNGCVCHLMPPADDCDGRTRSGSHARDPLRF
jgi:hypothetical protein